ncbi:helix-turn-helix domain-containing protein [Spirosoma sp. HMF4905]|uniref:Helix-turn-helix domain-containing protein n=1 Tax=Spirosoma arboris TaxID=2682092 RepID=A0A7K1SBH3_9BACT|nr:helix-turn-helix domain-containing protein [Spirosoma arboris]MVM31174.1 helix-turn-helix domain-containing protein [Spirosoma arboris]
MEANKIIITTPLELQTLIADAVSAAIKYGSTSIFNTTPVVSISEPDLLTIKKASEFVNLAVPTIYSMVGRNEIPFMKRAKKLYFSRQELESWIRAGRKKTTAECVDEVRADLKGRNA